MLSLLMSSGFFSIKLPITLSSFPIPSAKMTPGLKRGVKNVKHIVAISSCKGGYVLRVVIAKPPKNQTKNRESKSFFLSYVLSVGMRSRIKLFSLSSLFFFIQTASGCGNNFTTFFLSSKKIGSLFCALKAGLMFGAPCTSFVTVESRIK